VWKESAILAMFVRSGQTRAASLEVLKGSSTDVMEQLRMYASKIPSALPSVASVGDSGQVPATETSGRRSVSVHPGAMGVPWTEKPAEKTNCVRDKIFCDTIHVLSAPGKCEGEKGDVRVGVCPSVAK